MKRPQKRHRSKRKASAMAATLSAMALVAVHVIFSSSILSLQPAVTKLDLEGGRRMGPEVSPKLAQLRRQSASRHEHHHAKDLNCNKPKRPRSKGLENIKIAPFKSKDKILCFTMTNSNAHDKLRSILNTWGSKCHRFVAFTNATSTLLHSSTFENVSVVVDENLTMSSYPYLWQKLQSSIRYLREHYFDRGFDWFLKVDDDSFVIMENLLYFLSTKSTDKPSIFGRMISYPVFLEDLVPDPSKNSKSLLNFTGKNENTRKAVMDRLLLDNKNSNLNSTQKTPLFYLQGGAYVLNRHMMEFLIDIFGQPHTISGTPPEDLALGLSLWLNGVSLDPSRDEQDRELFHPELPGDMVDVPDRVLWMVDYHKHVPGGLKRGAIECCSRYSISFHHVPSRLMKYYFEQLYLCASL
jgi:hypothetical protein